jgi:Tfp pilus assembly protein PilV
MMRRQGFSIIEVLFAISFLVMVGMAMISLNNNALRLVSSAELQTAVNALNEEALSVVTILHRTDPNFSANVTALDCGNRCYLACPTNDLGATCSLSAARQVVQLGDSKLSLERAVKIAADQSMSGSYVVNAQTKWGSGIGRQSTTSLILFTQP